MKSLLSLLLATLWPTCALFAQATSSSLSPLLKQHLQSSAVVTDELGRFLLQGVPPLVLPANAQQGDKEAERIRAHELSVLYHGWPKEWIDSGPKFEKVGVIERPGYRIVKLRFEIVPGFYSAALLYEPAHLSGKAPAILNVNGHGPGGKAVEHKQKRCINQARRGIIALNIEWFGFGELAAEGDQHELLRLLDLAGVNGLGLFYLEMRRGLDYLYNDPDVDRSRIGMTGLSGGGWQTMLLSSLDPRVGPSVPVAGFSSLTTTIEHPHYSSSDPEQNASDMRQTFDYAQLAAIRAPRPTLLIYNDMDDCCFRAGVVKQGVYTDIKPFFQLYGDAGNLQWYDNQIPGTHNYQIDSRQRSYEFFDSAFHLNASSQEDPDTDTEVRTAAELTVGLPQDNLTTLTLAQSFARKIHHELPAQPDAAWAKAQRDRLSDVARYAPVTVTHAWLIEATNQNNLESHAYRFSFSNGLSATGVLVRSLTAPQNAATTVIVSDPGMESALTDVGNDVNSGQRVLVLDPIFFGENIPDNEHHPDAAAFVQMLAATGHRALGIEASQVTAVVRWLSENLDHGSPTPNSAVTHTSSPVTPVKIVTTGPRSETVATVAAALEPALFSEVESRQSIATLMDIFDNPKAYHDAPDLMCLDLYSDFDFNLLAAIASPVKVHLSAPAPDRIFWH
jgi:dienelactone hydrolase